MYLMNCQIIYTSLKVDRNKFISEYFSNEFIEISQDPFPTVDISNFKELATNYTTLKNFLSFKNIRFDFKNVFFNTLSDTSVNNWVDIENIYYFYLKQNIEKNTYVL